MPQLAASFFLQMAVVLLASLLGKGVACWAAARFSGEDNPTSLAIGALMNARGLKPLTTVCPRAKSPR